MRDKATTGWSLTVLLALLVTVMPAPGTAQEQDAVATTGMTIYGQGTALVRAELDRALGPGEHSVRVEGLPTGIDADSLLVLGPGVTLLGTRGHRTYEGAEGAGASLLLDLEVADPVDRLELAYLTGGMSWSASYAMIVADDDGSARIDGYATLDNGSGTTYRDARVQLLAGDIQLQGGSGGREVRRFRAEGAMVMADAAPRLEGEGFAGYQLYTLTRPVTLRAGDTRRVRLTGAADVPVEREIVSVGHPAWRQRSVEPQPQSATLRYRVPREEDSELGATALPAGPVRVYQEDGEGRLQLLGISGIGHTPARQELVLPVGEAFDVTVTRVQTEFDRLGDDAFESAWRLELANATDDPVVVQVIEQVDGDWELLSSSHEAERMSAAAVRFSVPVPAEGEAELTYRIRVQR